MVITSLSWKERKNERNIMGNGDLHETSISETDYFVLGLEMAAQNIRFLISISSTRTVTG